MILMGNQHYGGVGNFLETGTADLASNPHVEDMPDGHRHHEVGKATEHSLQF